MDVLLHFANGMADERPACLAPYAWNDFVVFIAGPVTARSPWSQNGSSE